MSFEEERPVHFRLRGERLSVRRSATGEWCVSWRGSDARASHLDHALAALLERRPNEVVDLAVRILRADPGSSLD